MFELWVITTRSGFSHLGLDFPRSLVCSSARQDPEDVVPGPLFRPLTTSPKFLHFDIKRSESKRSDACWGLLGVHVHVELCPRPGCVFGTPSPHVSVGEHTQTYKERLWAHPCAQWLHTAVHLEKIRFRVWNPGSKLSFCLSAVSAGGGVLSVGLSFFFGTGGKELFVRRECWGLQWSEHGDPGKPTAAHRSEGLEALLPWGYAAWSSSLTVPSYGHLALASLKWGVATGRMCSARPGLPQPLVCSTSFSSSWCLALACTASSVIIYEYI